MKVLDSRTSNSAAYRESDADLVSRVLDGDSDAFARLFHAHKGRVYAVCLRMTNNPADADDLTQEAFIQPFRKLSTFRGESALSTWLHRVAVNTALIASYGTHSMLSHSRSHLDLLRICGHEGLLWDGQPFAANPGNYRFGTSPLHPGHILCE